VSCVSVVYGVYGVYLSAFCVVVIACVTGRPVGWALGVHACDRDVRLLLRPPVEKRCVHLLSKHPHVDPWDGVLVLSPLHARRETSGRKLERRGEADASRHPGSWPKMGRYPSRTDIGPMKWVTLEVVVLGGAH
jgi:hypothetical protein